MPESLSDRTFAVFSTPAYDAGEVYDETFRTHARVILTPLRDRLLATGRSASPIEDHSHYGVAFDVEDAASGTVHVLLQCVDPWLLTLTRQLNWRDRLRRAKDNEVDAALVAAVDAALTEIGVSSLRWMNEEGFNRAASGRGPVGSSPS